MQPTIAILTVKACYPALRKQLFDTMEPSQFTLINAITILLIAIMYFIYMEHTGNKKEGFTSAINTYKKLDAKHFVVIFILSLITFVSSIAIFQMDKEHGIAKSNIMQKSLDLLIVAISGYLLYNEKLNYRQIMGLVMIMIGFKLAVS